MDLPLHPAAAKAIDDKGFSLLKEVEKLVFPAEPQASFPTEHIVAKSITDDEIIGELRLWAQDASGQNVFGFLRRNGVTYGLTAQSYSLVERLIEETLKVRWVQKFLSKAFIEDTIIKWCQSSFDVYPPNCLSALLVSNSKRSIKKHTIWAPIAFLTIEASFFVGSSEIAPMTAAMFDKLETTWAEGLPQQADEIRMLFSQLRKKMQGGAAVVLEIEAERGYVCERGLAVASDVVGLLRFLSPASNHFQLVCPNALLGAELIPQFHVLMLSPDGGFFDQSGVVPKHIAYWTLSASAVAALQSQGLPELGRLISEDGLNQFQQRLRACLLAYTRGTTFSETADRLVYTCSALEGLLLKDTSEPIQQNLGERMAFLLTKDPARRSNIVANVREVYGMRSRYIHHRISITEVSAMDVFTANARAALHLALISMTNYKTPQEFTDAIDLVKFGG